jgi:hypothetical protein
MLDADGRAGVPLPTRGRPELPPLTRITGAVAVVVLERTRLRRASNAAFPRPERCEELEGCDCVGLKEEVGGGAEVAVEEVEAEEAARNLEREDQDAELEAGGEAAVDVVAACRSIPRAEREPLLRRGEPHRIILYTREKVACRRSCLCWMNFGSCRRVLG